MTRSLHCEDGKACMAARLRAAGLCATIKIPARSQPSRARVIFVLVTTASASFSVRIPAGILSLELRPPQRLHLTAACASVRRYAHGRRWVDAECSAYLPLTYTPHGNCVFCSLCGRFFLRSLQVVIGNGYHGFSYRPRLPPSLAVCNTHILHVPRRLYCLKRGLVFVA